MIPYILISLLISNWKWESSLNIKEKEYIRFAWEDDENIFKVETKSLGGQISIVEEVEQSRKDRLWKPKVNRIFYDSMMNEKRFCQAQAWISFPSPDYERREIQLNELFCQEGHELNPISGCYQPKPVLENSRFKMNAVTPDCDWLEPLCKLDFDLNRDPSNAIQVSVFSSLWIGESLLLHDGISVLSQKLEIDPWTDRGDRSSYDASKRLLSYGAGERADGLDVSVVWHEWAHSLLDDINPRTWGYESRIIHEALSDFFSARLLNSPCFGAYDSKDSGKEGCSRMLENEKSFRNTPFGANLYEDSLVVSGLLWKVQSKTAKSLIPLVFQAFQRVSKNLRIKSFVLKMIQIAGERNDQDLARALESEWRLRMQTALR